MFKQAPPSNKCRTCDTKNKISAVALIQVNTVILSVVITKLRNGATHVETAGKGHKPPGGYMLTKCSNAQYVLPLALDLVQITFNI